MNVLALPRNEFEATARELEAQGMDTTNLRRQYREENSFLGVMKNASKQQQEIIDEGRRPVAFGLASKPVGATGFDALLGLRPEPKAAVSSLLSGIYEAVDNPAAAFRGDLTQDEMQDAALNTGSTVMGGGLASSGRGILDYDPNTARVFAGRRAAARVGGSRREAMAQAQKLFDQGVKNRDVYDQTDVDGQTGVFRGADGKLRFEVDDSAAKVSPNVQVNTTARLEDYLDHPELFELYPTMRGMPVDFRDMSDMSGAYGSFSPSQQRIQLAMRKPEDMLSTLLHEVQHSIQNREGFSGGSTPQNNYSVTQAKDFANALMSSTEAKNMRYQSESFNNLIAQAQPFYQAQYIDKLDNIISKSAEGRSKPSDINRLSDWYQYSDDIRRDIGVMPNRAGPERDNWIATAARKIKEYNLSSMSDAERAAYNKATIMFETPKDRNNVVRNLERKIKQNRDGHFGYRGLANRAKSVQELDAMEAYLREAGEVEARNVQTRHQLGSEGDSQSPAYLGVFPFETADFAPTDQILTNLRAGENLTDVSSRRRLDPRLAAALNRGLLD